MSDGRPQERGREPGNWELMRGIERLERRFDDAAKGFVSLVVHELLVERVKDVEKDVTAAKVEAEKSVDNAKKEAAAQVASIRTELDNAKKTRAQTWTAIGLLAAGSAINIFFAMTGKGMGL